MQAETLVRIRLDLGLLTDAFEQLRTHCHSTAPADKPNHQRALIGLLADWALQQTSQQQQQEQQQQQQEGSSGAGGAGTDAPMSPRFTNTLVIDLTAGSRRAGTSAQGAASPEVPASGPSPLQHLLHLPLDRAEEQAVVEWLQQQASSRTVAA